MRLHSMPCLSSEKLSTVEEFDSDGVVHTVPPTAYLPCHPMVGSPALALAADGTDAVAPFDRLPDEIVQQILEDVVFGFVNRRAVRVTCKLFQRCCPKIRTYLPVLAESKKWGYLWPDRQFENRVGSMTRRIVVVDPAIANPAIAARNLRKALLGEEPVNSTNMRKALVAGERVKRQHQQVRDKRLLTLRR